MGDDDDTDLHLLPEGFAPAPPTRVLAGAPCPALHARLTRCARSQKRMSVNGDIPMPDAGLHAFEASQSLLDGLGDHDRPVAAAGAADADSQVRLPFRDILRNQEPQQVERMFEELMGRAVFLEERADLAIAARMGPELRPEVRLRQEADIEKQIRVYRDPMLESEAQDGDDELGARRAAAFDIPERVTQLVHG